MKKTHLRILTVSSFLGACSSGTSASPGWPVLPHAGAYLVTASCRPNGQGSGCPSSGEWTTEDPEDARRLFGDAVLAFATLHPTDPGAPIWLPLAGPEGWQPGYDVTVECDAEDGAVGDYEIR